MIILFVVINCDLVKIFVLKCKLHAKGQMVHISQDLGWQGVLKSAADWMLKINTLNAMTADLAAGFMKAFNHLL